MFILGRHLLAARLWVCFEELYQESSRLVKGRMWLKDIHIGLSISASRTFPDAAKPISKEITKGNVDLARSVIDKHKPDHAKHRLLAPM